MRVATTAIVLFAWLQTAVFAGQPLCAHCGYLKIFIKSDRLVEQPEPQSGQPDQSCPFHRAASRSSEKDVPVHPETDGNQNPRAVGLHNPSCNDCSFIEASLALPVELSGAKDVIAPLVLADNSLQNRLAFFSASDVSIELTPVQWDLPLKPSPVFITLQTFLL